MRQPFTLPSLVELAITTEQLGARFYRRLAGSFEDRAELAALFEQLAREEEDHENEFTFLRQFAGQPGPNDSASLRFLRAMAWSQYFTLRWGPFENVDAISDELDALKMALDFEKGTLAFYEAVRDALGASEIVDVLVAAERGHVLRIVDVMAELVVQQDGLPEWAAAGLESDRTSPSSRATSERATPSDWDSSENVINSRIFRGTSRASVSESGVPPSQSVPSSADDVAPAPTKRAGSS